MVDVYCDCVAIGMSRSILDYLWIISRTRMVFPILSSQLPSRAIALANKEVVSALQQNGNSVKRQCGSYLQPVSNSYTMPTTQYRQYTKQ